MKKRPTGHYKHYSYFKGRDTAPTTSSREGSCIVDLSTSGERTLLVHARAARAILSRDRTEMRFHVCIYNLRWRPPGRVNNRTKTSSVLLLSFKSHHDHLLRLHSSNNTSSCPRSDPPPQRPRRLPTPMGTLESSWTPIGSG